MKLCTITRDCDFAFIIVERWEPLVFVFDTGKLHKSYYTNMQSTQQIRVEEDLAFPSIKYPTRKKKKLKKRICKTNFIIMAPIPPSPQLSPPLPHPFQKSLDRQATTTNIGGLRSDPLSLTLRFGHVSNTKFRSPEYMLSFFLCSQLHASIPSSIVPCPFIPPFMPMPPVRAFMASPLAWPAGRSSSNSSFSCCAMACWETISARRLRRGVCSPVGCVKWIL